jgi:hypothetical protein
MSLPLQPQLENEIIDQIFSSLIELDADVAKLVDALDLGSSAARHGGSSPSIRTTQALNHSTVLIKQERDWGFLVHHLFNFIHLGNYIRQAFSKSSFN